MWSIYIIDYVIHNICICIYTNKYHLNHICKPYIKKHNYVYVYVYTKYIDLWFFNIYVNKYIYSINRNIYIYTHYSITKLYYKHYLTDMVYISHIMHVKKKCHETYTTNDIQYITYNMQCIVHNT